MLRTSNRATLEQEDVGLCKSGPQREEIKADRNFGSVCEVTHCNVTYY